MSTLSIKLTPGAVMQPGEKLTMDKLNKMASPTVDLAGTLGNAQVADNSIGTVKLTDDVIVPAKMKEGPQAMGSSGAVTLDCSTGWTFAATLAGNITSLNLTNLKDGQQVFIAITQAASGTAFTVTWAAALSIKWRGGLVPTQTATFGKTDLYMIVKVGTNIYGAVSQAY